jgi:hypothetical protein
MIDIAILWAMAAAGATLETILAAIEIDQKADADQLAKRRANDAGLKSRSAAFSRVTVTCYRMGGSIGAGTNSLVAPGKPREEAPCST